MAAAAGDKPPSRARGALLRLGAAVGSRTLSLCWATYALGVLWLLLHPAVTVSTGELKCRGTYMSENALLIDQIQARSGMKEVQAARAFHQELARLTTDDAGCGANCSHVIAWMERALGALDRVDAYRHTFYDARAQAERTNVYGILRASPLADGKESIVLVTHYRNAGRRNGEASSVSMGLALLQYLASAKWLAKDVILLVADDGELDGSDGHAPGTDAWLRAYHMDPADGGSVDSSLPNRAGLIRAALSIETRQDSRRVDAAGVYAAGMNGQLPNLDLINTAVRALRQQSIPVVMDRSDMQRPLTGIPAEESLEDDADILERSMTSLSTLSNAFVRSVAPEKQSGVHEYVTNLRGMLRFMKTLSMGPSGIHASFIGYNIDAITLSFDKLRSSPLIATPSRRASIRESLRSAELVVRALSNLEEKLHQSFFLYVLPNPSTFVSIGEYYYPVALAISPAIAHLAHLGSTTVGMRVAFAIVSLVIIEAVGAVVLSVLLPTMEEQWWVLLLLVTIAELALVAVIRSLRSVAILSGCSEIADWKQRVQAYEAEKDNEHKSEAETATNALKSPPSAAGHQDSGWRALKFFAMVLLVYAHCIMGILNYPMALFCAIFMAHFARVAPASTVSVAKNLWIGAWLALSSPLGMFAIANIVNPHGAHSSLAFLADGFLNRINLLALPYACLLYVPVHVLSLAVWTFDTSSNVTDKHVKQD